MKENLISDKSLIYQCYFNDNISVVDNPRVKAIVNGNPTFKDGVATFNGSTCYLGNRAADDRTLNGWLNDIRLEQSILTLEEITQFWSSTKYKY